MPRLWRRSTTRGSRKRLLDMGCAIPDKANRTPQALQKRVESELVRWASVLKAAGANLTARRLAARVFPH